MKRVLAVLIGAGMAVGGGAAAWAGTTDSGGPNREAAKACRAQARQEAPDASKAELRDAVRTCLAAAGIEGRTPTPEQKARRESVRSCLEAAKAANPDGDKAALRAAAAACLQDAGVAPGRLRARLAGARACLAQVRADHPDAEKAELRALVKECVAAK
jgi:hypothetical protein